MSDGKSRWEKYQEKHAQTGGDRAVKPWDLVNPQMEKATEEEASRRYDICKACPELVKLTKQCKKCGCFMKLKTGLQAATCPIGKW